MKHALILCAIVLPTCLLAAPQPDKLSPDVASFETGVICAPPSVGEAIAPGTVAGTTHIIEVEPPFVSVNNRVPAVLGIGFGAKTMADNIAGIDNVTMTITHPPMGPTQATSQTYQSHISGLDPSLTFYQFDYDYELLTGIWQMQAEADGRIIYRTTFEVLPPDQVPELAAICGFENLLS
jgi:hypothetical protein